jgi:hypothetical protein
VRKLVSEVGPGVLLTTARIAGNNEAYVSTGATSSQVKRDAVPNALSLAYTPPVAAWVRLVVNIGLISCDSAAYNYLVVAGRCTPADQDGVVQAMQYGTQHSGVNRYGFRESARTFRCAAATAYVFDAAFVFDGGTWTYYQGVSQLWMELTAWAQ